MDGAAGAVGAAGAAGAAGATSAAGAAVEAAAPSENQLMVKIPLTKQLKECQSYINRNLNF